ncbi:MAG: hypothetical protein AAB316_08475 [Bacteroidota bacterium]
MKTGKDIFTLFREGGQRLHLQPSPKAWDKLESRLGGRRREIRWLRVVHWQQLAAAAAVIGFVALAGFYFVQRMSNKLATANFDEAKPSFLEPLDTSGGCEPYCLLMKERHELPEYYAQPAREEAQF